MRIRALGFCAAGGIQEVARIMLVENMSKVIVSPNDQRPVLDLPPYSQPFRNDIVIDETKWLIVFMTP